MRNLLHLIFCASSALASYGSHPPYGGHGGHGGRECLTYDDAYYLVHGFVDHVATPGQFDAAIGNRLVAEGASTTSQSVNALEGKTGAALEGVTFDGKQAILDGEKGKPSPLKIEILGIDAVGCNAIGWRWRGTPGNATTTIRAVSIFYAVKTKGIGWQISKIFGEFDSLTWARDFGATVTLPPPP